MYQNVKTVVNAMDPIGLIKGGAPEDEYDLEINKIIELIEQGSAEHELADRIYQIFVNYFTSDLAGEKSKYTAIAERILVDLDKNDKVLYE